MTPEEQINRLLAEADNALPLLQETFKDIIYQIRDDMFDMDAAIAAIDRNDIDGLIAATHIEDIYGMLSGAGMSKEKPSYEHHLNTIFALGALIALGNLSAEFQRAIAYDYINERAMAYLRAEHMRLALEVVSSSLEGVRVAIDRFMVAGTNPTVLAENIKQLVGLTAEQTTAVANFRNQLETKRMLGLTPPRERRLDASDSLLAERQINTGFMSQDRIDAMVEKYYQSMLEKRALDIARTESLRYVNSGQQELWNQGVQQGIIDINIYRKFWVTMGDNKVRPTHRVIPGMNPYGVKIDGYFNTPHGYVMGPGNVNSGFINCRCGVYLAAIQP